MDEVELTTAMRELERRLSLIEIDGTPNLRERVARLEGKINHLNDPEVGVYPTMKTMSEHLRTWAIVLLAALVLNLVLALIHIAASGEFP